MKKYQDRKDKVVFPVTSSYKLDGIFAVVRDGRFVSKNGNEFVAISDMFSCFASSRSHGFEEGTEGELYCPGMIFDGLSYLTVVPFLALRKANTERLPGAQ